MDLDFKSLPLGIGSFSLVWTFLNLPQQYSGWLVFECLVWTKMSATVARNSSKWTIMAGFAVAFCNTGHQTLNLTFGWHLPEIEKYSCDMW